MPALEPGTERRHGEVRGRRSAFLRTLVLACALLPFVAPTRSQAQAADLDRVRLQIVERTNAFRQGQGLTPTQPEPALDAVAREFAQFMARTDRYSHQADGREPSDRAAAQGYEYCVVTENIAFQQSTAGFGTDALSRGFFTGWQNSPGHRRNMLDPNVVDTGVAIAQSQRTKRYYAVQMFGRPWSQAIGFRIANRSTQAVRYRLDDETIELRAGAEHTHQRCTPPHLSVQPPGAVEPLQAQPVQGASLIVRREAGSGSSAGRWVLVPG